MGIFSVGDVDIPEFPELNGLPAHAASRVMFIPHGGEDDPRVGVARLLRDLLIELILGKGSDLHLTASAGRLLLSSEMGSTQINRTLELEAEMVQLFREKLFALTNTPQGGSTPDLISTRFQMELPIDFVRAHGLAAGIGSTEWYSIIIRVQYAKTFNGWAFILRQLDQQRAPPLEDISMSPVLRKSLMRALKSADGLILVTGPTGSGKTTLLNAMLSYLNDGSRIIGTIENPVEYELSPNAAHVQLDVQGNITFANGLRALLRAHPRLILVGEIRDQETMEIAIQAAQSGHLVFATLHTIDTIKTITRAVDLAKGVDNPGMRIAQVLRFVVAVRLVKVFDPTGAVPRPITRDERSWMESNGIFHPGMTLLEPNEEAPSQAEPVVPVLEGLSVDLSMEEAICSLDESRIFSLAAKQPQFETLAQAGFRAVLERGATIDGCHKLGSSLRAQEFMTQVAGIAKDRQVTHAQAMNILTEELDHVFEQ